MTLNYTSRLGLNKPDEDEFQLIDTLNHNMDVLDSYVGVKMVSAGVIPPVNQLYDGLIVNERDTGKTWIASANGSGGYDRAWIRYPWSINALSLSYNIASNTVGVPPLQITGGGTNSSAADIVGGKIKIPISGIYRVDIHANFGPNANSASNWRSVGTEINGVATNTGLFNPINQASSNQAFQYNSNPLLLSAGALIAATMFQNSGLAMPGCQPTIAVTLISVTGKNNN